MSSLQPTPTSGIGPRPSSAAVTRPGARSPMKLNRAGPLTYVFLGVMVLLSIFPFYWMFAVGSNTTAAVNAYPPKVVPGGNFIDHARFVFERIPFGRSIMNSFIVSGTIAVTQVVFCTMAGFALSKLRFKGRNALFVIVIATLTVPVQLGIVPQYMLIAELGWLNTLRALIIPGAVGAFGVFWMRQYIDHAIPDELLDAGRVDGATNFRMFRSVVFPIVRPGAVALAVLSFLFAWNDFFFPLIVLSQPDSWTVQVALRQLDTQAYVINYSVIMTGTVIGTLPILILFALLGKQLMGGVMEGAVKA